jgi:hypothetical protein
MQPLGRRPNPEETKRQQRPHDREDWNQLPAKPAQSGKGKENQGDRAHNACKDEPQQHIWKKKIEKVGAIEPKQNDEDDDAHWPRQTTALDNVFWKIKHAALSRIVTIVSNAPVEQNRYIVNPPALFATTSSLIRNHQNNFLGIFFLPCSISISNF